MQSLLLLEQCAGTLYKNPLVSDVRRTLCWIQLTQGQDEEQELWTQKVIELLLSDNIIPFHHLAYIGYEEVSRVRSKYRQMHMIDAWMPEELIRKALNEPYKDKYIRYCMELMGVEYTGDK